MLIDKENFVGDFYEPDIVTISDKLGDISDWTFWKYDGGYHCHNPAWGWGSRIYGKTLDALFNSIIEDRMGVGKNKYRTPKKKYKINNWK